ncbi:MAG: hypothetical protein U5O39_07335 [Gammaproteobacteria bacterium]|nr:hypothetical protein [Gammaproteobacteria bacterium]
MRGRSGVRLSDRFKQYYDLVATRNNGASQSLAVIASDIYLDMDEASRLIAATRQEIGRAALMEQLEPVLRANYPGNGPGRWWREVDPVWRSERTCTDRRGTELAGDAPFVSPLEM